MSRSRVDDAGSPGQAGRWKDGLNLDCGLPAPLLVERRASGPWRTVENARAPKNRFYVARLPGERFNLNEVLDLKVPVAWVGADRLTAERLCERFNGYEMARDFPPAGKPAPLGCAMP